MSLTIYAQPAVEPVTVERLCTHLRVDYAATTEAERTELADLIQAAREYAEEWQGRAYITRTYDLSVAASTNITLPMPVYQLLHFVASTDEDGQTTTISSSDYTINTTGTFAVVTINELPLDAEVITVRYETGYGDAASDVPARIRQALLLLCGHWYENREPIGAGGWITEMCHSAAALLNQDRVQWGAL